MENDIFMFCISNDNPHRYQITNIYKISKNRIKKNNFNKTKTYILLLKNQLNIILRKKN